MATTLQSEVRHDMQQADAERLYPSCKSILREYIESIAIATICTTFIILFLARSFVVDGSSMQPTLEDGQRLLVDEISYRLVQPKRGEIIVFNQPGGRRLIKRIIGMPRDVVEVRGGKVYVNSTVLNEDFLSEPAYDDYGPVFVPDGQYLVLGDNRNNSDDGRGSVGFLDRDLIIGRAVVRFWPITKMRVFLRPAVYRDYDRTQNSPAS